VRARNAGISIHEPPAAKPEDKHGGQVSEQQKRHQHPLPSKGKSAFVGKGKATAPPASSPLPPVEVAVVPTPEAVEPPPPSTEESREPSSPKPVAAIIPKPIVSTEEKQNQLNEQLDIPVSTSQIDADIALSSDTSDEEGYADTYVIDTDAEDEREDDPMTDVEPDVTPEEIAAQERRKAEQLQVSEQLEPLILTEFRETVVISDETESIAEAVPPTNDAGPILSTSAAPGLAVAPSASSTSIDVTARKPTRHSKPHISVRRLKTTVPQLQQIPRPPEAIQQACRRLKSAHGKCHRVLSEID